MRDGSGSEDGDASEGGASEGGGLEAVAADADDVADADDAATTSTPGLESSADIEQLASSGVAVFAEGEDREAVQADLASNRGLRRAAKAAEREARLLESRRRKLGIRVGDPSSSGVGARGASSAGRTVGAGEAFGAFEKHTSGFGSRMLAKMGFQGEGSGVGKGGTGIAEPVAAVTRAKRVGLGAEKRR